MGILEPWRTPVGDRESPSGGGGRSSEIAPSNTDRDVCPLAATQTAASVSSTTSSDGPRQVAWVLARVLDPEGRPVPGARVHLQLPGYLGGVPSPPRELVVADDQGDVRLSVEGSDGKGSYWAWAEAPSWAPTCGEYVSLRGPDEAGPPDELRLRRGGRLRGRVLEHTGAPVARVSVSVAVEQEPRSIRPPAIITGTSDAAGRFDLPTPLPEGLHDVRLAAQGYAEVTVQHVPVTVERGGEVEVTLDRVCALEGVLLDERGAPARSGTVYWRRADGVSDSASVGSDGRWSFAGVAPGRCELRARSGEAYARSVIDLGDPRAIELQLHPGARLEGRAFSRDGSPVSDSLTVERPSAAGARRWGVTVRPDADGRWAVRGPPGRYLFRDGRSLLREVDAPSGVTEVPDLVIDSPSSVGGRVLGVGHADWVQVRAVQGEQVWDIDDTEGSFTEAGLAAGPLWLLVRGGRGGAAALRLELTAGQELSGLAIELRAPRRVRGRVVDPRGRPFPGLCLVALGSEVPDRALATTDERGEFLLEPCLEHGSFTLTAEQESLRLEAWRALGVQRARLEPVTFQLEGRDLDLGELRLATER